MTGRELVLGRVWRLELVVLRSKIFVRPETNHNLSANLPTECALTRCLRAGGLKILQLQVLRTPAFHLV